MAASTTEASKAQSFLESKSVDSNKGSSKPSVQNGSVDISFIRESDKPIFTSSNTSKTRNAMPVVDNHYASLSASSINQNREYSASENSSISNKCHVDLSTGKHSYHRPPQNEFVSHNKMNNISSIESRKPNFPLSHIESSSPYGPGPYQGYSNGPSSSHVYSSDYIQSSPQDLKTNSVTNNKQVPRSNDNLMQGPGSPSGGSQMNFNNSNQRLPGHYQQTGTTPTLNQLLQSPNSVQRFHPPSQYSQEKIAQYPSNPHNWTNRGTSQFPPLASSNSYRTQETNSDESPSNAPVRPSPSPTGSRSMSPAIGSQNIPMPPRPASGQSESNPNRISHSPMAAQGSYQQQMPPPPHMGPSGVYGGKLGHSPPGPPNPNPSVIGQNSQLIGGPYPSQYPQGYRHPSPLGNYPSYPPPGPGMNQTPPGSNYDRTNINNHIGASQGYPGFQYNQGWSSHSSTMMNSPIKSQIANSGSVSPLTQSPQRPNSGTPHYLRQHLQQKMGFTPQTPPSSFNGPSNLPGPPIGVGNSQDSMMPPSSVHSSAQRPQQASTPQQLSQPNIPQSSNSSIPQSIKPPPNSPNSVPTSTQQSSHQNNSSSQAPVSQQLPVSQPSSQQSNVSIATHSSQSVPLSGNASGSHSDRVSHASNNDMVQESSGNNTSAVTGSNPVDDIPIIQDEASQHSTISNASQASGEERAGTPRKDVNSISGKLSHPPTPQSTIPSPGAASMGSYQEENETIHSPNWTRMPASPVRKLDTVYNCHITPPDLYRPKKPDALSKLYEMDDNPDRRAWLDKLLRFMDEKGTPITTCPTISKNPLDLHKLYLLVRDHGGFIEVSKSKTWKDIAGLMGIGASSSAAYTLRKHYTKHLLPFECRFDRGGIDPQPIISQFESTSKKKSNKNSSVPSPGATMGSSSSQDGFSASCTNSGSMDGYPNVPHGSNYGYPGSGPDYHMTNSSSSSNAGNNMHSSGENMNASNPFDDQNHYMPRTNTNQSAPGMYGPPPYQTPVPPRAPGYQNYYPPQSDQFVNRNSDYGQTPNSQTPYSNQQGYPPRSYVQPSNASQQGTPPPPPPSGPPHHSGSSDSFQNRYNSQYQQRSGTAGFGPSNTAQGSTNSFNQSDQFRQEPYQISTNKSTFIPPTSLSQSIRGASPTKDKAYNQGQSTGTSSTVFSNKSQPFGTSNSLPQRPNQPYPSYVPGGQQQSYGWQGQQHFNQQFNQQQWSGPRPMEGTSQWGNRYPYPQQNQQQWPHSSNASPSLGMRQPFVNRPPFPPKAAFSPLATPSVKASVPTFVPPTVRKEVTFPPDSIESVGPLLMKRKRLNKLDVQPIDPWRIMMALKSGLLAECTWALDVLNILLFDDNSVLYFGLQNLPGLLEVLLEHFRQTLVEMFDITDSFDIVSDKFSESTSGAERKWYERPHHYCKVPDLGSVTNIDFSDKKKLLHDQNYTLETRDGKDVGVTNCQHEILISDCDRDWDVDECFDTGQDQWQIGGIDVAQHIITKFTSDQHLVPFVKVIQDKLDLLPSDGEVNDIEKDSENFVNPQAKDCVSGEITVNNDKCDTGSSNQSDTTMHPPNPIPKSPSCVHTELNSEGNGISIMDSSVESSTLKLSVINDLAISASQSSATIDTKNTSVKLEISDNVLCSDEDSKPSDTPGDSVSQNSVNHIAISSSAMDNETEYVLNGIRVRDPARTLKRKFSYDYEEECYSQDEASLNLISESQEFLAKRCLVVSNILRSLSFLPGNDVEMSKTPSFLVILGKLLLLNHEHPIRCTKRSNYDREEDVDFTESCSSLFGEKEWWWDDLYVLRENALVTLANISGQLDLSVYPEEVARPVLDGLLHWAVCPSAYGKDPFPSLPPHSVLSPQRLSLESLSKLCVQEANVDLVLATPPFSRLDELCGFLAKTLFRNEDQVMREFAINVLHYFASADMGIARTIALHNPCISLLISFIEQAEQNALGVANTHGINMLRENPDSMGTSLDMLRRAARTLLSLARVPDNRALFVQQEQRLLSLVMSQILDQHVAGVLSKVLYEVSRNTTREGTGEL